MKTAEDKSLLKFLTWYEEITGEEQSELNEHDENQWWHWKTWQKAIESQQSSEGAIRIPTRKEMEDAGIEWTNKAPILEEAEGVAFVGWESCYTWMIKEIEKSTPPDKQEGQTVYVPIKPEDELPPSHSVVMAIDCDNTQVDMLWYNENNKTWYYAFDGNGDEKTTEPERWLKQSTRKDVTEDMIDKLSEEYYDNARLIAWLCDEVLDRTGGLLGKVRDASRGKQGINK